MAFWVFYGHLKTSTMSQIPFWGHPAIAVDVFMLLSGFLMLYTWRIKHNNNNRKKIFNFYIRRFFRIAPLYYFLLCFSFIFSDFFRESEMLLRSYIPPYSSWDYATSSSYIQSFGTGKDIFTHFTFIFGLIPKYISTNPMPDWSLSLEMQFYFVFPLLMLLIDKIKYFYFALAATLISFLFVVLDMRGISFVSLFGQPSFLPFKINVFVAGMLITEAFFNKSKIWLILLSLLTIIFMSRQLQILTIGMIFFLFYDFNNNPLFINKFVRKIMQQFGNKFFRFLGKTSYAVYLIHFMIIFPTLAYFTKYSWFMDANPIHRFLLSFIILTPIVYGLAYILHIFIESPGIKLGKKIISNFESRMK